MSLLKRFISENARYRTTGVLLIPVAGGYLLRTGMPSSESKEHISAPVLPFRKRTPRP